MAEQVMSEVIVKAVAEATRIAIQTIADMQAQRVPSTTGPKLGSSRLKQPNFTWEAAPQIYRMEVIHSWR